MSDDLYVWTIYNHPRDFPNSYVARKFSTRGGATPTKDIIVSPTLSDLRFQLKRMGLTCLPRSPGDEPQIVESWI
jgi:hypothetical protein